METPLPTYGGQFTKVFATLGQPITIDAINDAHVALAKAHVVSDPIKAENGVIYPIDEVFWSAPPMSRRGTRTCGRPVDATAGVA